MTYDYTPVEIVHNEGIADIKRLSEELRLGYVNGKFKWLVGFYGDKNERNIYMRYDSMYPAYRLQTEDDVSGNTYAFFSNLIYPVTEKFSVSAGLRYKTSDQDYEEKFSGVKTDGSWDATTPTFSINYEFSQTAMIYASAAKGYRPGGFNSAYSTSEYKAAVSSAPMQTSVPPGTVVSWSDKGLFVAAGDGVVQILELMKSSGKRLDAAAFLCGNKIDQLVCFE